MPEHVGFLCYRSIVAIGNLPGKRCRIWRAVMCPPDTFEMITAFTSIVSLISQGCRPIYDKNPTGDETCNGQE